MTTHAVVPDTQQKPGVDFSHMTWAGEYLAEKRPDVIVHIGDHADMPSLSSYDKGKRSYEGRTYKGDVEAAIESMELFLAPIRREQKRRLIGKKKQWNPRLVFTMGNHEDRINRAIEEDRKLEGLISTDDLKYKELGWEVIPYQQTIVIDGIAYCHFQTSGEMGKPITTADALVKKKYMSCVVGHSQKTQISMTERRADGVPLIGLFSGIYYLHDEKYLGPQGNKQHRQIWYNTQVGDGFFYPMGVSIEYLKKNYSC
jgi:hypothetical protein